MTRYPDVDRGWAWVVMAANFAGIVIYCCTMYMSGVFYIALLDKFGEGKAKTSLVGALSNGFLCFFGPVASICINKFGCRITMLLGGAIVTVSNVISAFVNSLDALIVSAGALSGIGYALSAAALIVSLGYYFQHRRNQVLSASFVVVGGGLFLASPVGLYVLNEYGLSGSFLMVGCLNAQLLVIATICRPSSIETQLQRDRARNRTRKESSTIDLSLMKNKSFILFLLSTASWNFALIVAIMHLPNYMAFIGSTDAEITLLMTVFSVSNTIGRLLAAMTVGKGGIDSLLIHVGVLGVCGLVTTLFPLYSGFAAGRYLFAIQLGLYVGCPNALMTTICVKMLGVSALSEANGFSYFFCGIGVITGPVVAGYVFGATGAYNYSFFIAGVVLLSGSALGMASSVSRAEVDDADLDLEKFDDMETVVAPPSNSKELFQEPNGICIKSANPNTIDPNSCPDQGEHLELLANDTRNDTEFESIA